MAYSTRFKLQRKFFEDMQTRKVPVAQLLQDLGVSYAEFEIWIGQPSFQARLKRVRLLLGHIRELDLDRCASFSAGKMAENAYEPKKEFLDVGQLTHSSNVKLRASSAERKKRLARTQEPAEKMATHPDALNPEAIIQRMEERK